MLLFMSLIIPSNHVKPEQDLKQKIFWGTNTMILGLYFASGIFPRNTYEVHGTCVHFM